MITKAHHLALRAALAGLIASATMAGAALAMQPNVDYVPGELIVTFHEAADVKARTSVLDALRGRSVKRYDFIGAEKVIIEGLSVPEAIRRFADHPAIKHIEPNLIMSLHRDVNDPRVDEQWFIKNVGGPYEGGLADCVAGADSGVSRAWNLTTGSRDVVVGIVDTGVHIDHPDLVEQIWVNEDESAGDGIDNDWNGYVDDVHGWDFYDQDNDPRHDDRNAEKRGHGTHVAGVLGAAVHNEVGGAGIAWNIRILPLRVGEGNDVYTDEAIEAIDYAIDTGVEILNHSWGTEVYHEQLRNAFVRAADAGIISVVSAGNDQADIDAAPRYPASFDVPLKLTVSATDCRDDHAWFSNYGPATVDIAAPGRLILSTFWPDEEYRIKNGTSQAAPVVAGALALLRASFPEASPDELITRLLDNADSLPSLVGKVDGARRVNIFKAMAQDETWPPSAIDNLRIDLNATNWVRLAWTAPGDDGEVGRAGVYDIRRSPGPIDETNFDAAEPVLWPPWPEVAGTNQEFKVEGLAPETTYYFAMRTSDEWERPENTSPISNLASTTTLPPPDVELVPRLVSESVDKGSGLLTSLTVSNVGPGVLDYEMSPAPGTPWLQVRANGEGFLGSSEPADVEVYLNAAGVSCGTHFGELWLDSNDPDEARLVADVEMNVGGLADVALPGGEYLDFGAVRSDEAVVELIEIRNEGCEPLYVLGTSSSDPHFVIKNKVTSIPAESSAYLAVELVPAELGAVRSDIVIQTSDTDEQFSTVSAVANVLTPPALSYSPGSFEASLYSGQRSIQTLTISNGGEYPLDFLLRPDPPVGWLDLRPDQGSAAGLGERLVDVVIDATGVCEGTHATTIVMRTNDRNNSISEIPVQLFATSERDIDLEPAETLDFGVVEGSATRHVEIRNLGCLPLTVSRITSSSPVFQTTFTRSKTLAPGEHFLQAVTFGPPSSGTFTGTLGITSDDPDESQRSIALVGSTPTPPDDPTSP